MRTEEKLQKKETGIGYGRTLSAYIRFNSAKYGIPVCCQNLSMMLYCTKLEFQMEEERCRRILQILRNSDRY